MKMLSKILRMDTFLAILIFVISAWGIWDFNDHSRVIAEGDRVVGLGVENKWNPFGAQLGLLCRNNLPLSFMVDWRRPVVGDSFTKIFDQQWLAKGSALSKEQYPVSQLLASEIDNRFAFKQLGLSSFYHVDKTWGETLVGQPIQSNEVVTLEHFFNAYSKFSFHNAESMFRFKIKSDHEGNVRLNELCK